MSRTLPRSAAPQVVRPADGQSGFTLIELLVALMISGLLVGVIFQLMQGQGRFMEFQSAREEVQQNSRAAAELIGGELRTVPGMGGLVRGDADSLTMRVPRIWGVVCFAPAGSSTIDIAVPHAEGVDLTPADSTGVAVNLSATGTSTAAQVLSVAAPESACNGQTLPVQARMRRVTISGVLVGPQVGDPAYLYDQVTYRTGNSAGVDGLWILRRSGGNGNQPFAGPVVAGGTGGAKGLEFQYYDAAGVQLPSPLANPDAVRSIRLMLRTTSDLASAQTPETKADTVVISLRNRF